MDNIDIQTVECRVSAPKVDLSSGSCVGPSLAKSKLRKNDACGTGIRGPGDSTVSVGREGDGATVGVCLPIDEQKDQKTCC